MSQYIPAILTIYFFVLVWICSVFVFFHRILTFYRHIFQSYIHHFYMKNDQTEIWRWCSLSCQFRKHHKIKMAKLALLWLITVSFRHFSWQWQNSFLVFKILHTSWEIWIHWDFLDFAFLQFFLFRYWSPSSIFYNAQCVSILY